MGWPVKQITGIWLRETPPLRFHYQARRLSLSPAAGLILFVAVLTLVKLTVAAWTPLASDEVLYGAIPSTSPPGSSTTRS